MDEDFNEFVDSVRQLYRTLERASEELCPAERRLRDGIGVALVQYDRPEETELGCDTHKEFKPHCEDCIGPRTPVKQSLDKGDRK